jgi:hypothetical protein
MSTFTHRAATPRSAFDGKPSSFDVTGQQGLRPADTRLAPSAAPLVPNAGLQRVIRRLDEDLHRPRLCTAIADRLTFNGTIIETGTDSYHLAATRARAEAPTTAS